MRDWHSFALIVALGAAIHNVLSQSSIPSTGLPVGSCTPDIPCANGACCNGNSGFCGYGPDFCTEVSKGGNCTSHCDAIAECGEFAAAVNRTCPLNVCCSQYGFCGTTEEFCSAGCQNNCNPTPPVGGGNDVFGGGINHRRIGYYEGWAIASSSRTCDFYQPEQIAAETLTHVNFAFALISTSFQIIEMSPGDRDLWTRTTALKKRNASLKVYLSIGGWTFNDPPTSTIFSQLVASTANINAFISSALSIMQAYGFDGLDIDWEYPASYDRGGNPADKENYVTFMKALRGAFGSNYGLSFTAPSSFWYLQHFDLPGLLKYSDFVNIMTYDLHGTWDGTDPWIGKIVLAHTNLTEIKQTLQLFQNVAVDWAQVNIGFGFYGRSFELASAQCNTPGCAFSGPAAAGPCTGNPGTLSWSEIQHIIASNNLQPVLDADAAVKYVVWNDRQWVSYDDDETFLLKRDYLDGIVGGSFVWSVDQDDTQYTALKALYPEIGVNDPSSTQTNQCKVTGCGEGCPDNWTLMTTLTTPPTGPKCESNNRASLCCPKGAVPQNCGWHDTVLQGSGINCMGQCNLGQVLLALDPAGNPDWPVCVTGNQAYCCDSGTTAPLDCYSTGCGSLLSECPSGYTGMTFVKQGSTDNGYCADENKVRPTPITCPVVCPTNNKAVCCASESSYTNCHWAGTPPSCQDSGCGVGQVTVFQDIQGDASSSCVGNARRSYCCTPPSNEQFLPVPETWVIPIGEGYGTAEQPASFTVDYDDNIGPESTTGQGAGSTGIGDDGDENDSPFGELFVTSPNAQSVSSLDVQSDWVLVGCDAKSDQPQSVLAYCALGINDDDSGCGHVFIGQAQHTIVRMPSSCGRGPYARVISFDVHENQDELPVEHQDALPENEKVYRLNFDYNFAAIPEENGPVFMRADLTDIPGYWDAIVDSPPDNTPETKRGLKYNYKRNFHNPHEYQKRWFGGFKQWLARLNTITNSNSLSRNFHWSDTYTIYHAEESCPNFQSSLDISVSGQAQMNSQFGYYLEATVVPPAIQQAYVYVKAGASASATFTMKGIAKAEWTSDAYELISFGFPGLYYPGLLTLGPSLHLYGQLSGEISLTGTLSTTVGYTFPSIDYAIGSKTDEPTLGAPLSGSDASNNGYDYNFGYNVELSGGLTAYLTPSLELGLTVLGGAVMDATAYVQAELYAGINLNGSVSETQAPKVCVQPFYGVNLHGGLKGAVVFWSGTFDHTFYEKGFNFGGACYGSLEHNGKRDGAFGNITRSARFGNAISIEHEAPRAFYSKWERKADAPTAGHEGLPSKRAELPESKPKQERAQKRAAIPYLPGSLFCPAEAGDLDQTTSSGADCMCYSDTNQAPTGQLIDVLGRRALGQEDLFERTWDDSTVSPAADSLDNSTQFSNRNILPPKVLVEYAKLRTCNLKVRIPDYSKTSIIAYYDHDNPGALDPTIGSYTQLPLNLGGNLVNSNGVPVYAREHVYEQSLSSLFIDFLQESPNLWQTAQGLKNDPNQPGIDWCTWVQNNLFAVPAYMPAGSKSVMDAALGGCYPSAVDPFGRGLSGITGNMAVLEQTINEIKNTAFYDGERKLIPSLAEQPIRKTVDFSKECPQKQVAVIRAAAAIPSFLNEWAVRREFLTANTCIRGVWLKWYNAYLAATTVDAPNRAQVNVPNLYDNWIASIVKNIKPFLTSQITTLIGAYNDEVNGKPGGAPKVDLSFYVLMDNKQVASKQKQPLNTPPSVYVVDQPVSKADLTSQVLNKMPDLVLATLLPVH